MSKTYMDYADILVSLDHEVKAYRKAILNNDIEAARERCQKINFYAAELQDYTETQDNANIVDDLFHETFPNAIFPDDSAIYVWRAAWDAFRSYSLNGGAREDHK